MSTRSKSRLFSLEFVSLTTVSFFAFCNMAVFYSFFGYLERIEIPVEWRGFLVGLEPMSAFALRLAIIPLLHVGNAAGLMLVALSMLVVALFSYDFAVTIPSLIALRIFHGAAFVLLVSASMALVVHFIPKERSGQGFGFLSAAVLVPYAIMPPLTEALLPLVHNEALIYRGVTVLALPAFVLLLILRRRIGDALSRLDGALTMRPDIESIRQNLKEPGVILVLAVNLLIYISYASVFFFMKKHAIERGLQDIGSFFTISTLVMIALRLGGGAFFDRIDKVRFLAVALLLLAPCFLLISHMHSEAMLYSIAACYGLCIGFILPLLNSVMFDISPSRLRGLNANLALFMMDAGFCLSPYAGGLLLARGFSLGDLFYICAGLLLASFLFIVILGWLQSRARAGALPEVGR